MKYKGLTYSYTVYAFTFFLAPLLLILFYSLTAAGGDGTVNEVLNGMHDFDRVTFGCIPSGSANDFARGFGLAGTPREILEREAGA